MRRTAGLSLQTPAGTSPISGWAIGRYGLVLVNLADEPEYCEKLIYAQEKMTTPAHAHARKKEDIICRWDKLAVQVWASKPPLGENAPFVSAECIIGEVSTANDDLHDDFFVDPRVGRYPGIEEDEPPVLRLISEQ